jgi:hypothetical protein
MHGAVLLTADTVAILWKNVRIGSIEKVKKIISSK